MQELEAIEEAQAAEQELRRQVLSGNWTTQLSEWVADQISDLTASFAQLKAGA